MGLSMKHRRDVFSPVFGSHCFEWPYWAEVMTTDIP